MVYEGKPSEGCGTCRKRRIRCDLQRPICGQCIKSKRECLGYRTAAELTFVRVHPLRRGKGREKARRQSTATTTASASRESSADIEADGSSITAPPPLSDTVCCQALAFFISEFVALPRHQDTSRGFVEDLLPIYVNARTGSPLFDATAAAALASLSIKRGSSTLSVHARIYYGKAVTALQEAIADPHHARANETLMSIMVLGLFEAMTATRQSFHEWSHHADGAAALAQFRGTAEMLADPMSRRMYWAVRTQAIYNHVLKHEPLEPHLNWEHLWATPIVLSEDSYAANLIVISERLPALRSAASNWLKCAMSGAVALKCVEIIGNARIIDQMLAAWSYDAPTLWRARSSETASSILKDANAVFLDAGHIESYHDIWISSTWNYWRAMRILCNMLIINSLERLFDPGDLFSISEYGSAAAIIQKMANEICQSVPYHLGQPMPLFEELQHVHKSRLPGHSLETSDRARARVESGDMRRSVKTLGAYYLLLPLAIAYSAITLADAQREWLQGRLTYIAQQYGLGQAQVFADLAPTSAAQDRRWTISDYAPPAFQPYPDLLEIVYSPSFQNLEAIAELQASTAEARLLRTWRAGFIERMLDM